MKLPIYFTCLPFAVLLLGPVVAHAAPIQTLTGDRPVVIAHRGASGYLPEESVQSYQLAMSWAACYEKADASCAGTGYNIVSTNGTPQPKEEDKTLGVDVGNYKTRTVLVVCK